jgi:hypothetical protein
MKYRTVHSHKTQLQKTNVIAKELKSSKMANTSEKEERNSSYGGFGPMSNNISVLVKESINRSVSE